ncbi:hypothetical protein CBX59_001785 [Salmonella enterica]|nr:hypothetical protein [Salmonella enterica]
MTNKLTDERVLQRLSQFEGAYKEACAFQDDDFASECADIVRVLREVLERRNAEAQEYPETLPCPVFLEPGIKFGEGVRTRCMLGALRRRADYYAELESMTPEQRAEHDVFSPENRYKY